MKTSKAWTTDKPETDGFYLVYTPVLSFPGPRFVRVERRNSGAIAAYGIGYTMLFNNKHDWEKEVLWCGPLTLPKP